jgi:hypothetical protein
MPQGTFTAPFPVRIPDVSTFIPPTVREDIVIDGVSNWIIVPAGQPFRVGPSTARYLVEKYSEFGLVAVPGTP